MRNGERSEPSAAGGSTSGPGRANSSAPVGAPINRSIAVAVLIAATMFAASSVTLAQSGGGYDLTWYTVDGGGITYCASTDYKLGGTIGQPDAEKLAGGAYTVTGGFWLAISPGDCNYDGAITLRDYIDPELCLDGPEVSVRPSECRCFDLNGDGDVDLADFAEFQTLVQSGDG
jgi:hypothetical protein